MRVAYHEPFRYPLDTYLNALNWAIWDDAGDTEDLIAALKRTLEGEVLTLNTPGKQAQSIVSLPHTPYNPPLPDAQPPQSPVRRIDLESPEGTMDPISDFYVARTSDTLALESIKRNGVTITIMGPRQVGKSSLLMRLITAAEDAGKRTAFLDFQLFTRSDLENQDRFYRQFCATLSGLLDLADRTEEYWDP